MPSKKASRLDLHETLLRESCEHCIICTYTFETDFFEEYCLERFRALNGSSSISVLVDWSTYVGAILGPEQQRPKQANLRYLLHGVSVPGCFHPKIVLLVSKAKGLLLIGSANFTRAGITSNAELVACYSYDAVEEVSFTNVFQQAFRFVVDLSVRHPSEALTSNLEAMCRDAPWLVSGGGSSPDKGPQLVHNLDHPLWDQLTAGVVPPVDSIYVLSRYFDSQPTVLDRLTSELKPGRITIFTENGSTTMTKDWLEHAAFKSDVAEVMLCHYGDGEHPQQLHAKGVAIEKGGRCVFAFGSANFTSPAMFSPASTGNVEVLVVLPWCSVNDLKPRGLFDPNGDGQPLIDETTLVTAQRIDSPSQAHYEIHLIEATLIQDRVRVVAEVPGNLASNSVFAVFRFPGAASATIPVLESECEPESFVHVTQQIVQRLGEASTVLHLEARDGDVCLGVSNPILVTNLMDPGTGQGVRQARHIKEAEQSAGQFLSVLRDLIEHGDDLEMLTFLTYCDIPVADASRPIPPPMRRTVDLWRGMRSLGERNLRHFDSLHDAALDFFDRHFRRLEQQAEYGTLKGIINFTHIYLAMCSVLSMQLERAILGFASLTAPISSGDWHSYRERFDAYLTRFRDAFTFLGAAYVPGLLSRYDAATIKEHMAPDIVRIRELLDGVLSFRQRLDSLRQNTIKVDISYGKRVSPRYFHHNVLSDEQWPLFTRQLKQVKDKLDALEKT